MDNYQNKYRIASARLEGYDYGRNGAYFITICTKDRRHFFGEIVNGEMQLSAVGELAKIFWLEIPQHFPFVRLANFVVMPNHTHGILIVDKTDDDLDSVLDDSVETLQCNVSTESSNTESSNTESSEIIQIIQKQTNVKNIPQIRFHFHHYPIL